jgi:hypothetical protein
MPGATPRNRFGNIEHSAAPVAAGGILFQNSVNTIGKRFQIAKSDVLRAASLGKQLAKMIASHRREGSKQAVLF